MFRLCICLFCLIAMPLAGPARALDVPQGAPLLTVDGLIAQTNDGDLAVYDRQLLHQATGTDHPIPAEDPGGTP